MGYKNGVRVEFKFDLLEINVVNDNDIGFCFKEKGLVTIGFVALRAINWVPGPPGMRDTFFVQTKKVSKENCPIHRP